MKNQVLVEISKSFVGSDKKNKRSESINTSKSQEELKKKLDKINCSNKFITYKLWERFTMREKLMNEKKYKIVKNKNQLSWIPNQVSQSEKKINWTNNK